jgi:hypothetical protein
MFDFPVGLPPVSKNDADDVSGALGGIFFAKRRFPAGGREPIYALEPRKPELEAQRITRRLQLVKPVWVPVTSARRTGSGPEAGAGVGCYYLSGGAFESAHRARDQLPPVIREVQSLPEARSVAHGNGRTVLVKVHATRKATTDRQVRRQPFAGTSIANGDAPLTSEVVLGVFRHKHAVFTTLGARVAGFSLHLAIRREGGPSGQISLLCGSALREGLR